MRTASNICVVLAENKVQGALDVERDCHSHQTLGASCTQRPRRAMPAIQQKAKVSKLLMILTRGMVRDGAGCDAPELTQVDNFWCIGAWFPEV